MSLTSALASGIAELEIDDAAVHGGFGPAAPGNRGADYWQVIPYGGAGVLLPTAGNLRESNFQVNRVADLGDSETALASAELMYAALQQKARWTLAGYRVELIECYQEPMLRAAQQPGKVIAGFNIRVVAVTVVGS